MGTSFRPGEVPAGRKGKVNIFPLGINGEENWDCALFPISNRKEGMIIFEQRMSVLIFHLVEGRQVEEPNYVLVFDWWG